MKKRTQAGIFKVLGSMLFVVAIMLSNEWLLLPERFKAVDMYFLAIWLYLGAILIQTSED